MTLLAAQAQSVFLMGIVQPVLFLISFFAWSWFGGRLDKDADFFNLRRLTWNLIHLAAGLVGFGLMLLIPFFLVGFPLGLLIAFGSFAGYAKWRNTRVPEPDRWDFSMQFVQDMLADRRGQAALNRATLKFINKDHTFVDVPTGNDPQVMPHVTLAEIVDFAIPRGAERIDMRIEGNTTSVSILIDGVSYPFPDRKFESQLLLQVIDYVKGVAGMDVSDRRKKQTTMLRADAGQHGQHVLETTTAGSTRGVTMSFVIDPSGLANIAMDQLGFAERQKQFMDVLMDLDANKGGVVLCNAPPQQGQTTTMYSLIQSHDPYRYSIVTLEDEIAFDVEGVNHNEIPSSASAGEYLEKAEHHPAR